jgi:hypothetical protein
MRSIAILLLVFAAGVFLGGDFWPQSHEDPSYHFRFHRGRLPYSPPAALPTPTPVPRGRVHHPIP